MSNKKRGLGRGLSALIGDSKELEELVTNDSVTREVKNIDIKLIVANENQPRKEFDEKALKELSESIKEHGIIQPIIVRKLNDKFEIIAGERRYRASKLIKLEEIPAIVIDVDDEKAAKLALIENIQREDLNPVEEAKAYKNLIDEYGVTQSDIGKALGKSRSYVSNIIRLLKLEDEVLEYIYEGKLSIGHGKVLVGVENKAIQTFLGREAVEKKLSVREIEKEVQALNNPDKEEKSIKVKRVEVEEIDLKDPYIKDIEDEFMRSLGTKVNIYDTGKKRRVEIEYYNDEDLQRIYEAILGK